MKITEDIIFEVSYNLYKKCMITERKDVVQAFERAYQNEADSISKAQLKGLLTCIELAREKEVCRCQDTGTPQFWVTIGSHSKLHVDIRKALTKATARIALDLPMRNNVHNPLNGEWEKGGNTGWGLPVVWWDYQPKTDYVEIMVAPRGGGGSLSWSGSYIMPDPPSKAKAISCIKETILRAFYSGEWFVGCPPGTVGICIGGGSKEHAAIVAWKAVFRRPVGSHNSDPKVAKLEDDILRLVNKSGKGNTRGLSIGLTHLIGVHIEIEGSRAMGGLPTGIALSVNCNAVYDARARIYSDGRVEYLDV